MKMINGKPCKVWTNTAARGYGKTTRKGKTVTVHRLEWEKHNGPVPDGMSVLHHCDNPPCYEIAHLFIGTTADNHADRDQKGRQARLERHGRTHLTQDDVAALRKAYSEGTRQVDLATQFGISQQAVSRIVRQETWVA